MASFRITQPEFETRASHIYRRSRLPLSLSARPSDAIDGPRKYTDTNRNHSASTFMDNLDGTVRSSLPGSITIKDRWFENNGAELFVRAVAAPMIM